MTILIALVIACFITTFSLVLFLISFVNNNTKINKIKYEKIIEEKIYAEIPTEILSNIQKRQLNSKLPPIKEELLSSHTSYRLLHLIYTTFCMNHIQLSFLFFNFFLVINLLLFFVIYNKVISFLNN